jgi:hypothetical protein
VLEVDEPSLRYSWTGDEGGGLPAVLDDLDDDGALRPASTLKPRPDSGLSHPQDRTSARCGVLRLTANLDRAGPHLGLRIEARKAVT